MLINSSPPISRGGIHPVPVFFYQKVFKVTDVSKCNFGMIHMPPEINKKFIEVVSRRKDILRIQFNLNSEEKFFTIFTLDGEKEKYDYKEYVEKIKPQFPYSLEYDLKHSIADIEKLGLVVQFGNDECDCGIKPAHFHCGKCGKLLGKNDR